MQRVPILIVSQEAAEYARLLEDGGFDAAIATARSAEEARRVYDGQPVVLGEPDLVAEALPHLPGVEWAQSTWAGVEPLLDAARRGLAVTGVKGVFGPQMAEYALGYMLARELDIFGRREYQRKHHWHDAATGTLSERTLGVMGTGSIGSHIARTATVFGMRVRGFSRSGRPAEPFETVYGGGRLGEFLAGLDYLVAVLPDTPETDGLLDARALRALPRHCCLINVGRGNLVDEEALVEALREGRLGAAVLDVFRTEPLPANHPFWETPNLLLTAHVAAKSWPRDIAAVFLDNYRRFMAGGPLRYRFDPRHGY